MDVILITTDIRDSLWSLGREDVRVLGKQTETYDTEQECLDRARILRLQGHAVAIFSTGGRPVNAAQSPVLTT
jgi:hypothetical protein